MAIIVGILFYTCIVAAVGFVAPWHALIGEKFMTAVAFQQAVGSRWIVNIILAAALLSLFKCFNGNFVAASRLVFALGRRGLIDAARGQDSSPASDAFDRRALYWSWHGGLYAARRCDSGAGHRGRFGRVRDRMVGNMRGLSFSGASGSAVEPH